MATPQIHLPDRLNSTAQARAVNAGYGSIDAYIASLIEADDIAPISDELEAELLKGLNSGPAVEITPDYLEELKRRARLNKTA